MYRDMKKVHDLFASHLENFGSAAGASEARRGARAAEHSLASSLEYQAGASQRIRDAENIGMDASDAGDAAGAGQGSEGSGRVFLVPDVTPELRAQGPIATAKFLAEAAKLNEDQLQPVALIAKVMDKTWREEQARRGHAATEHTCP